MLSISGALSASGHERNLLFLQFHVTTLSFSTSGRNLDRWGFHHQSVTPNSSERHELFAPTVAWGKIHAFISYPPLLRSAVFAARSFSTVSAGSHCSTWRGAVMLELFSSEFFISRPTLHLSRLLSFLFASACIWNKKLRNVRCAFHFAQTCGGNRLWSCQDLLVGWKLHGCMETKKRDGAAGKR